MVQNVLLSFTYGQKRHLLIYLGSFILQSKKSVAHLFTIQNGIRSFIYGPKRHLPIHSRSKM